MPPSNVNIALGTGAIVATVVVAGVAIAVYQSPEVRQFAEDCRRRIAIALHSLGDNINPPEQNREPRFNRPEDAEGFMQSSAEAGVDADEESRRRQREELMYWNRMRLEKMEREEERKAFEERGHSRKAPTDFGDFPQRDSNEKGAYVYHSGSDAYGSTNDGLTRRRVQGVRGLNHETIFENPFADENHVEAEEQRMTDEKLMSPDHSEVSEDLYTADDLNKSRESTRTLSEKQPLVDVSEPVHSQEPISYPSISHAEPQMLPSDASSESAYASIQAWADNSNSHHASFYSPLPTTPQAALSDVSEPSLVSGQATPTDSASLAGSGVEITYENASSTGDEGRFYDFESEDGDGIPTPGSWTEVGSVVSETDAGHHH